MPPATPQSTTTTATSTDAALPTTWLRFGADGLFLADVDGEQLLVDQPIGWATSDGAGGVLFTPWNTDRFGPTLWLAAGSGEPVIVSVWDDRLVAARLLDQPVAVGPLPTAGCGDDGQVNMVAHVLATGGRLDLQCGVGGQDSGREPDSFGGGMYVGVEWNAVHPSGRSTDLQLVFRDVTGAVADLSTNPFDGDCSPCELSAALSPDGARLAVIQRPDAPPLQPDEYADWLASTLLVEAELRVFDLLTGETVFSRSLSAGVRPAPGSWFDGRRVLVGPDAFAWPSLAAGERGDAVLRLQQLLIEHGADLVVDGVFGQSTAAAVETFHEERFGRARSTVSSDTWAELGVPMSVIDTESGAAAELYGQVSLDVITTPEPPPGLELTQVANGDGPVEPAP